MEEQNHQAQRPVNPRRRKRSKWEIFKEAYLPVVIAGAAILLIIIFIIGSIVRNVERSNAERDASIAASESEAAERLALATEAGNLLLEAQIRAEMLDYDGAIAILDSFSGNSAEFPAILDARNMYTELKSSMICWSNPDQVLTLSFQQLIADPDRAFNDDVYANSYKNNFVTVDEFSAILQQLYSNGYILVGLDDVFSTTVNENGEAVFTANELYLPQGKKPLLLVQTNVNYCNYMVDSDGDLQPDKDGDGFASKLIIGSDGRITNEMVDSQGNTITGAYDLVPILDSFIDAHPDFSYLGAKALLAVTGYNGLFGYRTYPAVDDQYGTEFFNAQVAGANQIVQALRTSGYDFACYTYENSPYGDDGTAQIQSELQKWAAEVEPILGKTNIFVFAQNSDIMEKDVAYYGDKYELLKNAGFQYFLGFNTDGISWSTISTDHVRMGRILVGGNNLQNNAAWFAGILDPTAVLDPNR